jgi:hypothetical protein
MGEQIGRSAAMLWQGLLVFWAGAEPYLENPWSRAIGLTIIVYLTIRVIASVYSGDRQNSEYGPVGIRPHVAQRLDRRTIVVPRALLPMNMDGVTADCKIFYVFIDARGKRRKVQIRKLSNVRIGVAPTALARVASTIYGYEVPDVASRDVCFPPVDGDTDGAGVDITPELARDYASRHQIIEKWTEDDNAPLISMHANLLEEVASDREDYIVKRTEKVQAARQGGWLHRQFSKGVALRRPNVVGSFYIKFEFSHDPWFVLTRHPDRDLKMTAWLTVLTSMFAMIMDAWPKEAPNLRASQERAPISADVHTTLPATAKRPVF